MDFVTIISLLLAFPILYGVITLFIPLVKILIAKLIGDQGYAPIVGTTIGQLRYLDHIYDHQTQVAKKIPTFRLLGLRHSEIATVDVRNVEHILKTSFDKYEKGRQLQGNVSDFWGDGIFAANGDKWRQQRKLASHEFSTRVLRDFSCAVFRKNAAKLATTVSKLVVSGQVIEFQDLFMKVSMDSICKVGFGVDLNSFDWWNNDDRRSFIKAFDDANEILNNRWFDPLWRLKRILNIGSEATLKNNVKIVDNFVYNIINTKKKLLTMNSNLSMKEDILSRFLAESEKNPEVMTDRYLRDIILNFSLAGKDTTANTLCWFFYMLCKNLRYKKRLHKK